MRLASIIVGLVLVQAAVTAAGQARAQGVLMAQAVKPAETGPLNELTTSEPSAPLTKPSQPGEAARAVEATPPGKSPQPTAAARSAEFGNSDSMLLLQRSGRPDATTDGKAAETDWVVSETTSPVDYAPLVIATIWPKQQMNSGLRGLTISCRARQVSISLRFMDDLDIRRWGAIFIAAQIGDQRSVKQLWGWDEQQGTILTYDGDAVALLQSIPDGERLRLGVGDDKGARHMVTYQMVGLDAVRRRIASACPWPPLQGPSEKRQAMMAPARGGNR